MLRQPEPEGAGTWALAIELLTKEQPEHLCQTHQCGHQLPHYLL